MIAALNKLGLRPIQGARSVSVIVGSERLTIRDREGYVVGSLLRRDAAAPQVVSAPNTRALIANICFLSAKFGKRLHNPEFRVPAGWVSCHWHPGLYAIGGNVPNVWVGKYDLVFVPEWAPDTAQKRADQAEKDAAYHAARAAEAKRQAEDLQLWGQLCRSLSF